MKAVILFLLLALSLGFQWTPQRGEFESWFGGERYKQVKSSKSGGLLLQSLLNYFSDATKALIGDPASGNTEYPFFGFLPPYVANVIPGGPNVSYPGYCWQKTTFSASPIKNNMTTFTITVDSPVQVGCSDIYLLSTLSAASFEEVITKGSHSMNFTITNLTSAEVWDVQTNGVRVFIFLEDLSGLSYDLNATAALFASYDTQGVDSATGALNVEFLEDYAWHTYNLRSIQEVSLDESQINSGDFLGVIRMDGLDPMLAWAMGSTTGHTTVALRDPDGVLHICESTIASAYWPTDNIQCTEYTQWLSQAKAAGYQVTHAPLSPASLAVFNASAAWDYFLTVQGFEYGFYNQFWGWLDTDNDNYPCLPPDWTACLSWHHFEILSGLLDVVDPDLCNQFFKESLNLRLGTVGLSMAEIYQTATNEGITTPELYSMVELDSYVYQTNRYGEPADGPSMVCCVFVCNVWKNGGLFLDDADSINCGEFANWDDYSMLVFDPNYVKPPQCEAADPNSPTCQLEGAYTLVFNDYNTKDYFPHMAENCPSKNPNYTRPDNC